MPSFRMCEYVFRYGNGFYNQFFGYRELRIYERKFSKFISGRKKVTYNPEFREILKKTYSIKASDKMDKRSFKELEKEWDFYVEANRNNFIKYNKKMFIDYNKIYNEIYSYMKLLSDMNYTKSNFRISVIAIIISIIAVLVSVA
jgi:hypothetical protein